MEDKELEKTKALNELEMLEEKDDNVEDLILDNMDSTNNDEVLDEVPTIQEEVKTENQKMDKKKKIMIIGGIIVFVLLILGIVLYFVLNKKEEKNNEEEKPEDVVLVESNYTYKNGVLTIFDKEEKEIGTYECHNKDEELCYVAFYENNEDEFNTSVIYVDDELYLERSTNYQDLIFIYDSSKDKPEIVLYDLAKKEEIDKYTGLKKVNDNFVIVKKNDIYVGLKIENNTIQEVISGYDYLTHNENLENDYLIAGKNNVYYLLDLTGREMTKGISGQIVGFNDTYLVVKNNDTYKVVDYNGEDYLGGFSFIELYDDFVAVVEDGKLYLRGYGNTYYNMNGIKLNNNNYRRIKKYNNKELSEEYAYKLEVNNEIVTITLDNNEKKTIDLLEGKNSEIKKYYSYLDGKLYFYSDEAKENLIGSYSCDNKNTFNEVNGKFNSCDLAIQSNFSDNYKVAVKSSGYVPIYFNRFVFISDNSSLSNNKSIILYDLVDKKTLGSYSEVDAGIIVKDISMVSNESNVICKNKDNEYGMITITNSGISAYYDNTINFKVIKMERLGNEVIVEYSDKKWQALYSKNTGSMKFDGKIMNYNDNYFVIKSNDQVKLYDGYGKIVDDNTYDYIDLLNVLYVAVKDDKAYIKNYQGKDIVGEGISLNSNNYYDTDYPAFKISIQGTSGLIEVLNSDLKTYTPINFSTVVDEVEE